MDKPSISDTLRTTKINLIDYLGKDLYSILESGRIETDAPFGFKSKFDFRRKNLNLQKKIGDDYRFDFDINKRSPYGGHRDLIRLGVTKEF